MNIQLNGKLVYLPGKKGYAVYYHFTDQFGVRQRISLHLTVTNPEKNRHDNWVFPLDAYTIARTIDKDVRESKWRIPTAADKITIKQLVDRYFELDGNECAPGTRVMYRTIVEKFVESFGNLPLARIDEPTLIKYKNLMAEKRQNRPVTIARDLRHLSALFAFAVRQKLMGANPVTRTVKIKKLRKGPVVLFTPDEMQNIFGYMQIQYPDALNQIRFLLYTGFRETESCELRWDKIDRNLKAIYHFNIKAGREELYPCTPQLWDLLESLPHTYDPYVFRYRKRYEPYNALRRTKKTLGITTRIHIHTLKKNYSTAIGTVGTPQAMIPSLTHHTTMQVMQDSYMFVDLEEKRKWLTKAHEMIDVLAKKWQKSDTEEKIVGRIENTKAR
ncbi:MAG: tyrosine-type recombinase/integrase [Bacteroidota bacterium]